MFYMCILFHVKKFALNYDNSFCKVANDNHKAQNNGV